jgi:hypothetical protein
MIVALVTTDVPLRGLWQSQVPSGWVVLDLLDGQGAVLSRCSDCMVVVADASCEHFDRIVRGGRGVVICVGEPGSVPYERARLEAKVQMFLSYSESQFRLQELMPLAGEIALGRLRDEPVSSDRKIDSTVYGLPEQKDFALGECLDLLEASIDVIDSREKIMAEVKRAIRRYSQASEVFFLMPRKHAFESDCGRYSIAADDPLIVYLSQNPIIIDRVEWIVGLKSPIGIAIRGRMHTWGAKLLVPMHKSGMLQGVIVLATKEDGSPYSILERKNMVALARFARKLLEKCVAFSRSFPSESSNGPTSLRLPSVAVICEGEQAPGNMPVVVKDLVGRVKSQRCSLDLEPSSGQPFRARAWFEEKESRVWVTWESGAKELYAFERCQRGERLSWLQNFAITLNHELGNVLVPLKVAKQSSHVDSNFTKIAEIAHANITYLEALNKKIADIYELCLKNPSVVDIREVVRQASSECGLQFEGGPDQVALSCYTGLIEIAVKALMECVVERSPGESLKGIVAKVREVGLGDQRIALIAIRGRGLELEGVLPEPDSDAQAVPAQGSIMVLIAKEIVKMHRGCIKAGPGLDGPEIWISIRAI